MSMGLRLWNASGQLVLDTSDRLTRFVAAITVPALNPGASVFLSVPGYATDGSWSFLTNFQNAWLSFSSTSGGVTVTNQVSVSTSFVVVFFRG